MSVAAVNWALQQKAGDARAKVLLLALACLADKEHRCFPGRKYLSSVTELTADELREAMRALRAQRLVADTGDRSGKSGRAVVWVLGVNGPVDDRGHDSWSPPF